MHSLPGGEGNSSRTVGERGADAHTHPDGVLDVLERQRHRISIDLHDGPSQMLSAALLRLSVADSLVTDEAVRSELDIVRDMVVDALDDIQRMASDLQPASLDGETLTEWLENYTTEYATRSPLRVGLTIEGEQHAMSRSAQIALFRVVQEALANAHKHGHAREVSVRVSVSENDILCRIEDDGRGFDPDEVYSLPADKHHGLRGMAARVAYLDGKLSVDSHPGAGCKISMWIPRWQ